MNTEKTLENKNDAIKIFHALSHPLRLSICLCLEDGSKSVSQICDKLQSKQYMISQQLSILRDANIVSFERHSRSVIYSLTNQQIIELIKMVMNKNSKLNIEQMNKNDSKRSAFSEFARIL